MKDKKILVIGGCGFIGSAIITRYYKDNKIVVLDTCPFKNSSLELRNLPMNNIKYIQGDATDIDLVMSLDKDFDYIIHASAILGIKKVVIESINTIMTNIKSCHNALELASKQEHLEKFLTFSTSEIYGINAQKPKEDEPAIIEQANEGRWCYAASKTLSEHLVFGYHREKNVPIIIIRPFNVFGEYRKGSNAMTTFINKAIKNEDIYIDGDGQQVRAWCHIDDFIDGLTTAIESKYTSEVFNLGNPQNEITIEELAKKVVKITNSKSRIIITNSTEPDVKFRSVSIEKAKDLLGYNPKITVDNGIERVYKWIKEISKDVQ